MKPKHFILFIFICFVNFFSFANKTFYFTYDDSGNRINLTFASTCRIKDTSIDTTNHVLDTLLSPDLEVLSQLQVVSQPKIYPTLFRTDFVVSFPNDLDNGKIEIYDMSGNLIFSELNINTANTIVKLCDIPSGMYNVVVFYGVLNKEVFSQKIVKQ